MHADSPPRAKSRGADETDTTTSRRGFLGAVVAAVATVSALVGYGAGTAEAATPSGEVGTAAEPFRRAYADRMVFVPRTTDPSSPANGTLWYNESA